MNSSSPTSLVATISTPTCLSRTIDFKLKSNTLPPPLQADYLELRIDTLHSALFPEKLPTSKLPPLLFTNRSHTEGGGEHNKLKSAQERQATLRSFFPYATAIDWEWNSGLHEIYSEAKTADITTIASYHNFETTPSFEKLSDLVVEVAHSLHRPDILKIACKIQSPKDLANLFLLLEKPPIPLALMGMGACGPASRIALAAAGSALLYGYAFTANAPGQQSAEELLQLKKLWLPEQS